MSSDTGDDTGERSTPTLPALPEPVRLRLVQIAAEVVGRLPAEDVPPTLRAVARFTPAKRIRLGAPALSAALDADADFRERVAAAVGESTPQLVDAVQQGQDTPASDPLDTAVVAYLTRPDGWTGLVTQIAGRWADDNAAREAATEQLARLRAELAEARTALRAEATRRDEEVAEAARSAAAAAAEEATRLRNLLRARTADLRAAEQSRDELARDLERARAELDRARAEAQQRVEALEARIAEPAGTGEPARRETRREARADRDVDDARLRLLLDTLTAAAAGVRRELALPAGTLRPADVVADMVDGSAPGDGSAARSVDLDRLLDLPQVHLIVDGYNVTKSGYPDLPLADQRARLVGSLAALRARTGGETTVVFDGGARPPAQPRTPRGVRVLFSAPDEIADDLIRRLVAAEPPGRPLVVVTSDQAVVTDVARDGAWTVPSRTFLQRLG